MKVINVSRVMFGDKRGAGGVPVECERAGQDRETAACQHKTHNQKLDTPATSHFLKQNRWIVESKWIHLLTFRISFLVAGVYVFFLLFFLLFLLYVHKSHRQTHKLD